MILRFLPLPLGFILDLIIGDPHGLPHPVVLIGKLIDLLEKALRRVFPKTPAGETAAGCFLWIITAGVSFAVPFFLLRLFGAVSPWLRLAIESIMCWQVLAAKSLKTESMKVFKALKTEGIEEARRAVSMIVGRDTASLDEKGVTRAAVETVAENASDGVVAPMLFFAVGGAPLAFLYKAVNTMDSMLGYTDPPYTYIGRVPARLDDVFNVIPARVSALLMLISGLIMKLDFKNGVRIFRRDRYNHASPNSAQTEAVCAGLLGLKLAGDAFYHGVLHKKPCIGDPKREICPDDIPLSCRLLYVTAGLSLIMCCVIRFLVILCTT
ncbi:MAG: cobalamin biosynthesis protein CobD [Oscillospiraceae bacterium]|nr:cobalamin biosynthesis protein CobD [Oscillospiraceae bacterium]